MNHTTGSQESEEESAAMQSSQATVNTSVTVAFELFLRLSSGTRLSLNDLCPESTVHDVKIKIASLLPDAPVAHQRVIYKGRVLDNDHLVLSQAGVVHQSTLFLIVQQKRGNVALSATTTSRSASPPVTQMPSPSLSTSSTTAVASAGNDTGIMTGRLQQILQQQHPHQPERSDNFLTTPPVSTSTPSLQNEAGRAGSLPSFQNELLANLFSNSLNGDGDNNINNSNNDFLVTMLQDQMNSNPVFQRLMDENPQLRHMMNDPSMLRNAAQMMRNPEMMQQAMRQQDLALAQLENMPGGFAALSHMYRNVQAPLEESMMTSAAVNGSGSGDARSSGSGRSSHQSRPRDANEDDGSTQTASIGPSVHLEEGAAGTAMPNPWGRSRPSSSSSLSSTPFVSNRNSSRSAAFSSSSASTSLPWFLSNNHHTGNDGRQPPQPPPPPMMMMSPLQSLIQSVGGTVQPLPPANSERRSSRVDPNYNPWANLETETLNGESTTGSNTNMNNNNNSSVVIDPTANADASTRPVLDYQLQLQQLSVMGFDHEESALAALQAEYGNIARAVDRLLSMPSSSNPSSEAHDPPHYPLSEESSTAATGTTTESPVSPVSPVSPGPADVVEKSNDETAQAPPPKNSSDKKND